MNILTVPPNISDLFTKAKEKHMHKTRFSSSDNFYITTSRLSQTQECFARFGATCKLWNSHYDKFRQLPKSFFFKKNIQNMSLSILEAEDDYVEAPILLQKITNYVVQLINFPIF